MENFNYLFAAYSIIFTAIFFYVLFIWRRQARLDAELRGLESRLKELEAARPAPSDSRSAR